MAKTCLGFLGPRGTFSEEAAVQLAPPGAQLTPMVTFVDILAALEANELEAGVVPVENAIEGPVGIVLDRLAMSQKIFIEAELELPVSHALMAQPGTKLSDLTVVRSHPQALAQCHDQLRRLLPTARTEPVSSTAEAARLAAAERGSAALAHERAAPLYGLTVLQRDMQDVKENATRFVLLGHTLPAPTGFDKTSLVFTLDDDRAGGLVRALFAFAVRGINLTRIETRPLRTGIGRYWFFVDAAGHRSDLALAEAIDELEATTLRLRLLGSYPRYPAKTPDTPKRIKAGGA